MILFLGFAVLAALVLWAVIYAHGPWGIKLVLILTVPAYGLLVWHEVETWRGYPAPGNPPAESTLVGRYVDEPDAIYLWVIPPGSDEPRAFRTPYSREAHEALEGAASRAAAGARIGVRVSRGRFVFYDLPLPLPAKGEP